MVETFEISRLDRIADVLYGVAQARGLIRYVPLGRRIGVQPNHLGGFLERVSRAALERGEPLWSALVVSSGSQQPGSEFYPMARRMRPEYERLDDVVLWERERDRCYDFEWGTSGRAGTA